MGCSCEHIDYKGTGRDVLAREGCRIEEEFVFVLMGETGTSTRRQQRKQNREGD